MKILEKFNMTIVMLPCSITFSSNWQENMEQNKNNYHLKKKFTGKVI